MLDGRRAGRRRQQLEAVPVRDRHGPLRRARAHAHPRAAGTGFAVRVLTDAPRRDLAADGRARRVALAHAAPARAEEARRVPPLRRGFGPRREGARGRRVIAELARAGGAVGALGLALLILGTRPAARLGGLVAWAAGAARSRSGSRRRATTAPTPPRPSSASSPPCCSRWLFVRVPWLVAVAVLACAPARIPVSVGSTKANLLLPIYVVVVAAALALAWRALRGEDGRGARARRASRGRRRSSSAGPGSRSTWSLDRRQGAIYLLFFVLPFGLLAVSLSRLPWRIGWVTMLYVQLAAMALVFAAIGGWQYLTRNMFWNPKVIVDNAYAPSSWFYRVNSVFYDPSIYGRFLVVGDPREPRARPLRPARAWRGSRSRPLLVTWARARPVVLAVELRRARRRDRRRARRALAAARGRAARSSRSPRSRSSRSACRRPATGSSARSGFSDATGGRSKLVSNGVELARAPPVVGVGAGGFKRAYAERR